MRRWGYVLLCLVLCALYSVPAFADEWTVYAPDFEETVLPYSVPSQSLAVDEEDEYDGDIDLINDLGTASDWSATPSNASLSDPPVLYGSYNPYDSAVSGSVVAYMEDLLPKLGWVDYVLFRSGQYTYRLVYSSDMECSGSVFTAGDANYVVYDTRNYTLTSGFEGSFTLRAGDYLVYSNVGDYPMLHSGSVYIWVLIFLGVLFLLFTIFRAWFSPARIVY